MTEIKVNIYLLIVSEREVFNKKFLRSVIFFYKICTRAHYILYIMYVYNMYQILKRYNSYFIDYKLKSNKNTSNNHFKIQIYIL